MVDLLVLHPHKEHIILRKSIKTHQCHECHQIIPKGCFYVEDHINYPKRGKHDGLLWFVTNKICLLCWKGELPQLRKEAVQK